MVETDACDLGLGAVLMQHGRPIAYLRKGLAGKNLALSVYDKELLALVMAVTKWGHYLMSNHFIVKTDQKALKFLLERKLHTGSQLKWITKLMHYDFSIEYKRERDNKAVDALSRVPAVELCALTFSTVRNDVLQSIVNSWTLDPQLVDLIDKLQAKSKVVKGFSYINSQLRRHGKLVVGPDPTLKSEILSMWHDSPTGGHSGIDHTYRRIASLFHWKGLKADVLEYVKKCAICQRVRVTMQLTQDFYNLFRYLH